MCIKSKNNTCEFTLTYTSIHVRTVAEPVSMNNKNAKQNGKKEIENNSNSNKIHANTHTHIHTKRTRKRDRTTERETKKRTEHMKNITRFANLRVCNTIHCGVYRGRDNIYNCAILRRESKNANLKFMVSFNGDDGVVPISKYQLGGKLLHRLRKKNTILIGLNFKNKKDNSLLTINRVFLHFILCAMQFFFCEL